MRKLETFLGLTPARATPRLPVKQHDHALESLVANWADPAIADLAAPYAGARACREPLDLDALLSWRRRLAAPPQKRRRRLEADDGLSAADRARRLCIEGREQNHANTASGFGI